MTEFTDRELVRYALGDASRELAQAIEEKVATDKKCSDALALLGVKFKEHLVTEKPGASAPERRQPSGLWLRFSRKKWVAAACLAFVLIGGAWAGYAIFVPPPLLEDNFSSNTISAKCWDKSLSRPGTRAIDGYLRLCNRGTIVTLKEFNEPVEVEFDWRWRDHAENPPYSESLDVCFRTSGSYNTRHPFELRDGVIVNFSTRGNCVKICSANPHPDSSEDDSVPMQADEWHHIRITDDGTFIAVYMSGPKINSKYAKTPILHVRCEGSFDRHHISFNNRELVGGATHESHLKNISIRRFHTKHQE